MTVVGRVLDPQGKPIANARVAVLADRKPLVGDLDGRASQHPHGHRRGRRRGPVHAGCHGDLRESPGIPGPDRRRARAGLDGDRPQDRRRAAGDVDRPAARDARRGPAGRRPGPARRGGRRPRRQAELSSTSSSPTTRRAGRASGRRPRRPTATAGSGCSGWARTRRRPTRSRTRGTPTRSSRSRPGPSEGREMPRPGSTITLRPAKAVEVHVVHSDDGTPAAGALVSVQSIPSCGEGRPCPDRRPGPRAGRRLAARRAGPAFPKVSASSTGSASIRPRASRTSTPGATSNGPRAAVQQSVEFKLRRGVVVRGRVIEDPAGTPVADALGHLPPDDPRQPAASQPAGDRGRQQARRDVHHGRPPRAGAPARPGPQPRLRPRRDQLRRDGSRHLPLVPPLPRRPRPPGHQGRRGDAPGRDPAAAGRDRHGPRRRARRQAGRRGLSVRAELHALSASMPSPWWGFNGDPPQIAVKDGRFEIPGCDPDKPSTFYFLDLKDQLGATVELSGQSAADGPVTVRLRPTATVRYPLEGQGRQAARPTASPTGPTT